MNRCIGLAFVLAFAGCSKSGPSAPPADFPELVDKDSAQVDAKRPRGWKAYTGERTTSVLGFGPARNATVYNHANTAVNLADLWAKGPVVLVFYRGHW